MAWFSNCGPCSMGRHAAHIEHWNNPGPGILGGAFCICKGDCRPPDLSAILGLSADHEQTEEPSDVG